MKALRAALLDVDGTLVDSNDAHAQAWLEVFERNGYEVSFARVRELIGEGADQLIPQVTGLESESHEGKRLASERRCCFDAAICLGSEPFPKRPPCCGA